MLEAAIGISTLVQEQNVVRWTQSDMVDAYIRRLQTTVQRFAAIFEQLTNCHQQIEDKVNLAPNWYDLKRQLQ